MTEGDINASSICEFVKLPPPNQAYAKKTSGAVTQS